MGLLNALKKTKKKKESSIYFAFVINQIKVPIYSYAHAV